MDWAGPGGPQGGLYFHSELDGHHRGIWSREGTGFDSGFHRTPPAAGESGKEESQFGGSPTCY